MKYFTEDFLWGAATSAFQIEGHIKNDMSAWEEAGHFKTEYGQATNHWHQWEDDFKLLNKYSLNAYRFSVEWARIEPEIGLVDHSVLDQYEKMIDRLLELKIKPMLTLHHFTHPLWFHKKTPWENPESIDRFAFFVRSVMDRLASKIDLYITFNEPLVWALAAYGDGVFPPGGKDLNKMMTVIHNILLAHKEAYQIIKQNNSTAQIGIAKNLIVFKEYSKWSIAAKVMKNFIDFFFNEMLLDAFRNNKLKISLPFLLKYKRRVDLNDCIDFWGVNYYYRMFVRWKSNKKRPFELFFEDRSGYGLSDMGWEIYPPGLLTVLKKTAAFGKVIYITENGIASANDAKRCDYLKSHLPMISKAIAEGIPVKGYFHWSLLDNYEWLEGTDVKFGLVHVDFENGFQRRPKQSFVYFARYIKNQSPVNHS